MPYLASVGEAVILVVERAQRGGLRIASPQLPEWCVVVKDPHSLARVVVRALTDAAAELSGLV